MIPAPPIHILHVAGRMRRAGAETWLMEVLRHIDRRRFRMDFLVHTVERCDFDDEIRALGSRIIPCLRPARPWLYAREFRRIVREEGPYDVVHGHVHHFSGFALKLARAAGVPVRIAHSHNDTSPGDAAAGPLRRAYLRLCERWVRRHATHRLACSRRAIPSLFGSAAADDGAVAVLHYGLDFGGFRAPLDRAAVRGALGLPPGAFVVGHVARFVEQKNHRFVVEIAAELVRRRPETVVLLLGDGPLRPEVERQVQDRGLGKNVVFGGVRDDVPRLMRGAMDALLMPSRWEGLPVALIEAQAAGVRCFISDVISDEVDRVPGLVARLRLTEPAAAWAAAVLAGCRGAPPVTQAEALAVLERSSFDIGNCVARLEALYEHAIALRRAA